MPHLKKIAPPVLALLLLFSSASSAADNQRMDETWGERSVKLRDADSERIAFFDEGNYAMFIHWGLYSQLANRYQGKTYYGIGEWIMNFNMADIPFEEYRKIAKDFNPTEFDPEGIAQLAKDAGMKYIVITAKHHDGFAMFDSEAQDFNIVDQTPYAKDPMVDLANAARAAGLGFGFYYSHHKDWTSPGAGRGPKVNPDGSPATYERYFREESLPQLLELLKGYGPLDLIWFDTPGDIELKYVEELVAAVRKYQPNALINSRVGHDRGDYQSLGDMEVPRGNIEGLWETVDTTNDSWAYAWYDQNWKTPKVILSRLISTVGRGGTYMLNIGPRGDGSVPEAAQKSLRAAGEWIQRYPYVIYGADSSPWGHRLPWGDVTVQGNRLFLSLFETPEGRMLHLPGLSNEIKSVSLINGEDKQALAHDKSNGWTRIELPAVFEESLIPVIEVELEGEPEVDRTWGIDPSVQTSLLVEFAESNGIEITGQRWMEKFGEWKHVYRATDWKAGDYVSWEVEVLEPGYYHIDLTYAGEGRVVWQVSTDKGESIQNQQNSSHNYQAFPMGWLKFDAPGRYEVRAACIDGNLEKASLKAIHFTRVPLEL